MRLMCHPPWPSCRSPRFLAPMQQDLCRPVRDARSVGGCLRSHAERCGRGHHYRGSGRLEARAFTFAPRRQLRSKKLKKQKKQEERRPLECSTAVYRIFGMLSWRRIAVCAALSLAADVSAFAPTGLTPSLRNSPAACRPRSSVAPVVIMVRPCAAQFSTACVSHRLGALCCCRPRQKAHRAVHGVRAWR